MFSVSLKGKAVAEKKPKMTLQQFMGELGKQKGKFCLSDTCIRRSPQRDYETCPITAVCKKKTGNSYYTSDFRAAAREIGLPRELATLIAGAADNNQRGNARRTLRHQMLEVLGLKESA